MNKVSVERECEWRLAAYKFHFSDILSVHSYFLRLATSGFPCTGASIIHILCCYAALLLLFNSSSRLMPYSILMPTSSYFPFTYTFFNYCKFFILLTCFFVCLLTFIRLFLLLCFAAGDLSTFVICTNYFYKFYCFLLLLPCFPVGGH